MSISCVTIHLQYNMQRQCEPLHVFTKHHHHSQCRMCQKSPNYRDVFNCFDTVQLGRNAFLRLGGSPLNHPVCVLPTICTFSHFSSVLDTPSTFPQLYRLRLSISDVVFTGQGVLIYATIQLSFHLCPQPAQVVRIRLLVVTSQPFLKILWKVDLGYSLLPFSQKDCIAQCTPQFVFDNLNFSVHNSYQMSACKYGRQGQHGVWGCTKLDTILSCGSQIFQSCHLFLKIFINSLRTHTMYINAINAHSFSQLFSDITPPPYFLTSCNPLPLQPIKSNLCCQLCCGIIHWSVVVDQDPHS